MVQPNPTCSASPTLSLPLFQDCTQKVYQRLPAKRGSKMSENCQMIKVIKLLQCCRLCSFNNISMKKFLLNMHLKFSHLNVTSSTYSTFVRSAIFACYSSSISPRPFRMDKILWLLKLAILLLHSQWFRCKVIRERGDQSTSADANGALSYILELGGVAAGGWQMVYSCSLSFFCTA